MNLNDLMMVREQKNRGLTLTSEITIRQEYIGTDDPSIYYISGEFESFLYCDGKKYNIPDECKQKFIDKDYYSHKIAWKIINDIYYN